jgi:DNA invertase Pin-like site-specific DNA recombinase
MRAAVYVRQSVDQGVGIATQQKRCRELVASRGWPTAVEYADNATSASKVRGAGTAWSRMLDDVRAGRIDVVVAVNLDRLLRTQRDLTTLLDLGVLVVTLEGELDLTSASGEMQAAVLTTLARFETRRKSERQVRSNQARAEAGKVVRGRRPFGFDDDGKTVRPAEADAIREGYRMIAQGQTLAAVARAWTERGHGTPQGNAWNYSGARDVLLNPRNRGAVRRHGAIVNEEAEWEALVDRDTFAAVEAILRDPARRRGEPQVSRLLSNIAVCGVDGCGAHIHAGGSARRGVANYRCSGSKGHFARMAAPVEEHVVAVVVAFLEEKKLGDLLADDPEVDDLASEATRVRARLDRLRAAFAEDDDADEAEWLATSRALNKRLADVERRIIESARAADLSALVGAPDVRAAWDALPLDQKRRALRALPLRFVVHGPGRGVRTFDPATVQVLPRTA